jgi:hypothetical protein
MDERLLDTCRSAAEKEMPRAMRHREELSRLMSSKPGVLDGVAAARQDLWRLAHITVNLRRGLLAVREASEPIDMDAAKKLAGRLRRRIRRALVEYARVSQHEGAGELPVLTAARNAAMQQIGQNAEVEARMLGEIESRDSSNAVIFKQGVAKPLHDLVLDWRLATE